MLFIFVSGSVFDCVFSVFKTVPLLLLRGNFIILVLRPQQVLVNITVGVYKKHILTFHPLVYKKLKLNNSSSSNDVAILNVDFICHFLSVLSDSIRMIVNRFSTNQNARSISVIF